VKTWTCAWVFACIVALATGCGYSSGLRAAERRSSIGVEFFGNTTYERDVERALQDEITRALRDWTHVPLVNPDKAEVVIRGVVTEYHRRSGIRNPSNQLLETGLYIEAEAVLIDRASGRALGPPYRAGQQVGYVLDDPDAEQTARKRVLRYIADQLVLELFAPVD
jgi:hypothetical protein